MSPTQKPMIATADSVPRNTVSAGTKTSIQVLIPPDRAPHFAMRRFTIEPGGGMPNHTNTVEHEQYVVGGRAEVGIAGKVHQVKQGDVVYIPAGMPHWYTTVGDDPFVFLCLVPNQPDTIEIVEADRGC
jgi:quercetin dioxygenase-like cupin family protein